MRQRPLAASVIEGDAVKRLVYILSADGPPVEVSCGQPLVETAPNLPGILLRLRQCFLAAQMRSNCDRECCKAQMTATSACMEAPEPAVWRPAMRAAVHAARR